MNTLNKKCSTQSSAILLALGALFAAPTTSAQSALQAQSWAASCANCHGTDGQAQGAMVSLAAYPKDAFMKNMRDFISGARPATVMHQLAKGFNETQIAAMADYFAALPKAEK